MADKRAERGRFAEGNPGGPGRPKRETERSYLRVVIGECSLDEWRQAVRRAVKDAKNGDAKARDWLSGYLLGKPTTEAPSLRSMAIDDAAGVPDIREFDVSNASILR